MEITIDQVQMQIRTDCEPGKVVLWFDRPTTAVCIPPQDAMGIARALYMAARFALLNAEDAECATTH